MTDLAPLTPISLEAQDGTKFMFCPQSDATAFEAMLVGQLFNKMILSAWKGPVDWVSYVERHKLARHFVKVECGSAENQNGR